MFITKYNKMKPFNLERALKGDAVVTRNGLSVTQLHLFDTKNEFCLFGVVGGTVIAYTKDGFRDAVGLTSPLDLFMATKKKEYWVALCKKDAHIYAIVANSGLDLQQMAEVDMSTVLTVTKLWEEDV